MALPFKNNLRKWAAVILGPEESVWDGAAICLSMDFFDEYPTKPPTVKVLTPMFHPNIYYDGCIQLDILKERWGAAYDVAAVLEIIQNLLTHPNLEAPANTEAAHLYVKNRKEYD